MTTQEDAPLMTEVEAIEVMRAYHEAQKQAADTQRRQDAIAEVLRPWLEKHDGDLVDREMNLVASLQHREGAPWYDVGVVPDAVLLEARHAGAVAIIPKTVAAVRATKPGLFDALQKYRQPGRPTRALVVKKREE